MENEIANLGGYLVLHCFEPALEENRDKILQIEQKICSNLEKAQVEVKNKLQILAVLNPEKVLKQGYAILGGKVAVGNVVKITTFREEIEAKVQEIKERGETLV